MALRVLFTITFGISSATFAQRVYRHQYVEEFDASEAQEFQIDYSPIGKPRAMTYFLPLIAWPSYSIFAPRNGDVVLGRVVQEHPNWVQLLYGGQYMERQTCGVSLMKIVPPKKEN